ncbi:MAG TPA: 4-hydroxy-tetrahydrodipicolinate reductase [Flavobacterium sp.]|nr:4-hydroxy-tetrahydrodipicolinate reductase [Flavobacterium sp.]
MKIALLGYGKMGQVIQKIAQERGHEIVVQKSIHDNYDGLEHADVAIDFSAPDSAVAHISECLNRGIPIVSGTTGWLAHYDQMTQLCKDKNGSFIYGSNFSLGVNLFFLLNENLAKLMKSFDAYDVHLHEAHHTQKLDAPSGTAISLANQIIKNSDYTSWELGATKGHTIGITADRIENVPGTHSVTYKSPIDEIEIKHTAHNREGFALGAIIAAEWLIGKKGVFSMKDVLGL